MGRREPGLLLFVCGLIGVSAAFALMVEKIQLLQDPAYVPLCSVNALLSCTSVMTSDQAEVFGFPNPLLGLIGFAVIAAAGGGLLAGASYRTWFWVGLQIGVSAAFVFVHWLIVQSVYSIGALCPYCLLVWIVTAPVFWYTTLRNVSVWAADAPRPQRRHAVVRLAQEFHSVPLVIWYLAVLVVVALRFWNQALGMVL
ncbi:vitamin K epoxide reductase family protein [Kineococcus radiotolerans]|uniref:Vitamin K epoxide reductase n=1 Tax=Kineococcus radiotolerans (strain ATCC BAA-149 / DSM 14245 / SRS30216) TaxID=266940 RepID=A6WGU3_KINRD|nr:vitamin K epoxide reductase family protein [Kineococcus radiotolerans]ABS06032.1 Vitamin K epoxide reductase [Kineococcus radiotolerans SRS30216 = ATCC BAA-149]